MVFSDHFLQSLPLLHHSEKHIILQKIKKLGKKITLFTNDTYLL